jgi:hypothetical protein
MTLLLLIGGAISVVAVAGTIVGVARDGYGWARRRDCTPER